MEDSKAQQCVVDIRKWAMGMVNCSHALCSIAEAGYEERYGNEVLKIIEKYEK